MDKRIIAAALVAALSTGGVSADPFEAADLERWQAQFMEVVARGEKLFHGGLNSRNTVSCDECHPNATNTHPETYPKFQQQLGKVVDIGEMINWCIVNPLESDPLPPEGEKMTALKAYIAWERRGVPLEPGRH